MLTKRIIPCLDIHEGRTVKGVNFVALRDAGDPVELAKRYVLEGADELVFLDITATSEQRSTLTCLVRKVAEQLSIPFSVGGGVRTVDDAAALLDAGADKVCINSGAVRNPRCISELSSRFGSQCVVLACDGKLIDGEWRVVVAGGREITPLRVHDWLQEGAERGAGEVLLTSMEHDGTKGGFACELSAEVSERLKIPVIASGGAGAPQHFAEVFEKGRADGALAASVFHFGEIRIPELKMYLKRAGHAVRTVVDTSNALQEVQ